MIILGGYPSDPIDHFGYIGPRELHGRYMAGEVVTRTDALCDQSEWIVATANEFSRRDRDRLRWMVENLVRIDGKPERKAKA